MNEGALIIDHQNGHQHVLEGSSGFQKGQAGGIRKRFKAYGTT
jgi:hypothetical protein